jgi:CHAT domain-containing protein
MHSVTRTAICPIKAIPATQRYGRGIILSVALTAACIGSALPLSAAQAQTSQVQASQVQASQTPPTGSGSADILMRDSFAIGSNDGALCQVQSELRDPAITGMFDRAWTIICRDAAQAVGRVYALRGTDARNRIAARPGAASCPAGEVVDCAPLSGNLAVRRRVMQRGDTLFVAEGLTVYDDALRLALQSVRDGRAAVGTINVATTSIGDADALARIQVASLPADRALAEGYRQNNSGDYSAAAVYFEALERRTEGADSGVDPTEFTLNRALQLSNLGDFGEAERLFALVDATPTADQVQLRLRRNFRAMHALNRRDLDGALTFLATRLPSPSLVGSDSSGRIVITPAIANGINSGSGAAVLSQLADESRLTPAERAVILDAQADQLSGTVRRLQGNIPEARTGLTRSLTNAIAVRDGRVTTIIRLRAQIMGEIALVEEAAGAMGAAESQLRSAIILLETEYPETMALAAARAKLGAFMYRRGEFDQSLDIYRRVISALVAQRRQLTGLYNQMGPYYRMLIDRSTSDPSAAGEFFTAAQLLVRPGVADTQAVLARELSGGSGDAATLFRQTNNLSRDLERARIDLARLNAAQEDATILTLRAETQVRIDNLAMQQTATIARLAEFPQYRAVAQDALTLADLQATLGAGEAYAKLTVVGEAVYGMLVTRDSARTWRTGVTRAGLDDAVDQLRTTISVYEGGAYNTYPFDAEASHKLFVDLFGPVQAELRSARHLIFEPDGAMLRLPPNLLITDAASVAAFRARADAPGGDPFDMRGVAWLGRSNRVSTAVSALAFRNTRNAPASKAPRGYLGLGSNTPVSDVTTVAAVRAASPDAAIGCTWGIGEWNKPIAATELNAARSLIGAAGGDVVTGNAFTDRQVRNRDDLSTYRILHFATHGLVTPPRPECPNRPALLTSFDTSDSDGLLSFDEIFDLRIDADLVILSACDTAGQASIAATRAAGVTTGGGSALDGLVRAFIGAGGRSVLASHWPAPDDFDATQRLITGLFTMGQNSSVAEALGRAQDSLMDQQQTSHPYYWAGFAIIGDGNRPLLAAPVAVAGKAEDKAPTAMIAAH